MKNQENEIDYITNTDDMCSLKIDDMIINLEYTENNKSFKECMINILKLKSNTYLEWNKEET